MCIVRLSETTVITSVNSIGLYNGDCLLFMVRWKLNIVDLLHEIRRYKPDHIHEHSSLPEEKDKKEAKDKLNNRENYIKIH
jgi:hypothetical protein